MNIVFFGDSLTRGNLGISYVNKVAAALPNHRFINKGVNGDTTLNLYRRVSRDVLDLKPDAVFMMVGCNDAISFAEPGSHLYFRIMKGLPAGQVSPIAARENIRAILSRLASIPTWVGLPPVEYNPNMVKAMSTFNSNTAAICREMRVPALDLMAKLTPASVPERKPITLANYQQNLLLLLIGKSAYKRLHDAGKFTYSFDGFHLTEDGAQRFADLIVTFLRANGVT
jgi:lysophospholipase L1-like esterase